MLFNVSGIAEFIILISALLISFTIHEFSHAYTAYLLGDNTAKFYGRLSFNPLKHIDIIGFLMILVAGFGWAKSVPVNMNNFKDPKKGMAITSLAGPVSNIIIAFISCFLYLLFIKIGIFNGYILYFLSVMIVYNCSLAMFNFLPISPLDGSKILFAFLPQKYYYKLMYIERYGFIILLIVINLPIFNTILSNGVYNLQSALFYLVRLLPIW